MNYLSEADQDVSFFFLKIYLFERDRKEGHKHMGEGRGSARGRVSQAGSTLSTEPKVGHNLMTLSQNQEPDT